VVGERSKTMAVYVDRLISYGQPPKAGGERYFGNGKQSCHMMADTLEELHAMADKIGLRRAWFQNTRYPHYDLTPGKRNVALAFGAVDMAGKEDELLPRIRAAMSQQSNTR
jgi:hypothetical protein